MKVKEKIKDIYEKNGEAWAKFKNLPDDYINLIKENSNKNSIVLDVGCGGGRLTTLINDFVKKIFAIDYSTNSIKFVKKENPRKNVEYLVMDANKLQFEDNNFDLVVSHAVFCKKMCGAKALKECYRVLKPKGKLIIRVIAGSFGKEFGINLGFSKEEITPILKKIGFKKIKLDVKKKILKLDSFDKLKFFERTEVEALLPQEKMLKKFNKMKNPKFDDSAMNVYAEK